MAYGDILEVRFEARVSIVCVQVIEANDNPPDRPNEQRETVLADRVTVLHNPDTVRKHINDMVSIPF